MQVGEDVYCLRGLVVDVVDEFAIGVVGDVVH